VDQIQHKVKMTPRDFFLYLGAMAALYVSTVSFLTLLFQYANVLFPDPLESIYYHDPYSSSIRFAVASLFVIFPAYIFLTRLLNKDIRKHSEKRDLWIRKWLIYITLFVASISILVDLVILINTFLGGELTARFVAKVISVFIVVGAGFLYYFYDLRGRWETDTSMSKIVGVVVATLVFATVFSGFFLIGSPQTQRLIRFDQQKINDLQNIQGQVVYYWQVKQVLPGSLSDLEDPIYGFIVPADAQGGNAYGYRITGTRSFELCAMFNKESIGTESRGSVPAWPVAIEKMPGITDNWQHGTGETCFSRSIDPDLYPPIQIKR